MMRSPAAHLEGGEDSHVGADDSVSGGSPGSKVRQTSGAQPDQIVKMSFPISNMSSGVPGM